MATLAYLRVSTEKQADSGAGLDAQLIACTEYARKQGEEIKAVFRDEGVSGGKGIEERPGLLEAISCLRKSDVLVVAKRDRLGRDVVQVAMIEAAVRRKGGRIVSTAGEGTESDDPSHILMRTMIDAFSQYERHIISYRTKVAMRAKRNRGELIGAVPYGYELLPDGKTLEPNDKEQNIIQVALQYRESGLSYRAISSKLAEEGMTSRVHKKFSPNAIRQVLLRQKETTEVKYNG